MSSKKKLSMSTCEKCNCTMLVKDVERHMDFCSSAPNDWEISLVKPRCLVKGFTAHIEKWEEYLPPEAGGWLRNHSVLINPNTMNILDVTPRQPVRVQTPFHEFIGVLWPCKELGVLRLSLTGENATNEKLISVFPIYKPHRLRRVSISFKTIPHKINNFLEDYIQMYLNNTYVQPGLPISMNYYGKVIYIVPDIPVDFLFKNISLEDEELNTAEPVVFFLTSDCTISISVPSIETTSSTDPLSALSLIGGMHTAKKTLLNFVLTPFWSRRSCCSVLLWGLPGSGKTLLLSTVAKILGANAYYFQSMDEFYEQCSLIPELCVVILDWPLLDKEHKCFSKLARLIDGNLCTGVILSVRQAEDLDIGIRVRFPIEVEVDVPMEIERLEILRSLANSFPDDALVEVAKRTSGFTGGDLKSLVIASQFIEGQSAGERLEQARRRVRPTGIRQFILEVPHVSWEDIGGCEELKLEIQQAVIWPQQHKEAFERLGIEPPTGILLYGPPGCSKTLVARALANESNMNFLAVKGPELFSKWVGESEKAIRDLFARARQVAPTIVFFDEIDAVGSSRGSEKSSGVSDRVLAQLLTELDGLEKQNDVLLLAATNRPDQLDNALLRPGRLDRAIYVGLPCSATRRAIIKMRTKRMILDDDDIVDRLVEKTQGYSGAEIVAVCRHAALLAMREDITTSTVKWSHFNETLTTIVPRTDQNMLRIYEKFKLGAL